MISERLVWFSTALALAISVGVLLSSGLSPAVVSLSALCLGLIGGVAFAYPLVSIARLQTKQSLVTSPYKLAGLLREELAARDRELAQFRAITKHLIVSVIVGHPEDNQISFCSPYTEVLTGYPISEVYNKGLSFFRTIIHEEHTELFERALRFAKAGEPYQFQHSFHHRTGIEVWAETRTMPLLDQAGRCQAVLVITLNISQQMVYQRQVEERTREVQDFTYMLSHDLKAPIFTLKGMISLLQEELSESEPASQKLLGHITRAIARLEALVISVLEYAKLSSIGVSLEDVDLQEAIQETLKDFSQQLVDAHASVEVSSEIPAVEADPLRLSQILSNLVSNAIKYREQSRDLSLSFGVLPTASRKMITLIVKDNGTGIPADRLGSLFRPFHRAHGNEIEGTGIGLASVRKLLEKCGGSIDVESEVGKGTTFLVTFKRAA